MTDDDTFELGRARNPDPLSRPGPATPDANGYPPENKSNGKHLLFGTVGLGVGLVFGGVFGALIGPAIGTGFAALAPSPIDAAAESCDVMDNAWIQVGDEGGSVSMQSAGAESIGADIADVMCMMSALDMPDSVVSRIQNTRALDGRQAGNWNELSASWGYHPDNGLDMVIEITRD